VWLVDEHLQQGGVTVIYAPPGAGKSFFSLDLSFQVAKQDKRVVYVAPEGRTGYRKRTKAYMQHHKVKTDQIDFVFGNQLDMLDDENVTLFIEQIRFSGGASLIVLDTLASLNTGDENSAKDMQAFMRACGRLQDELDAAVLIVHHTGKSGSSERGSSALRGAADVMIELTNEDSIIKVSCSKSKDSEGFATYYLRLVQIDLGNDENSAVLLPSDKVVTLDSDALTERQQEVVDWLAEFWEDGARTSDLREALNMPRSTLFATLKTLKRRGIIDRDGKYDPYILTVKGHEYATVQKSKAVQLDQLDPIDASLV
ncbi:MAG: AAA family ATPase, partial [Pontibacterium sp.]